MKIVRVRLGKGKSNHELGLSAGNAFSNPISRPLKRLELKVDTETNINYEFIMIFLYQSIVLYFTLQARARKIVDDVGSNLPMMMMMMMIIASESQKH